MILTINIGIAPPSVLGVANITVPLGGTVPITRAMLMASIPQYYQMQGYEIGSINITGHDGDPNALLALNNQPTTKAWFNNNGLRVWLDTNNGSIYHSEPTFQALQANVFTVNGVQLGTSYVTFEARAILPDFSQMSELSQNVNGKIRITVVPVNNQPPSYVADNVVNVNLGSFIVLDASVFLVGYTDPENDPASMVRFNSVPATGLTLLNGVPVTVGTITSVQNLSTGALVYITDPTTQQVGNTVYMQFSVSDVGSQQFYG